MERPCWGPEHVLGGEQAGWMRARDKKQSWVRNERLAEPFVEGRRGIYLSPSGCASRGSFGTCLGTDRVPSSWPNRPAPGLGLRHLYFPSPIAGSDTGGPWA